MSALLRVAVGVTGRLAGVCAVRGGSGGPPGRQLASTVRWAETEAGESPPVGIPTMLGLPVKDTTEGLDACFVGVPLDNGATVRPGTRYGPRRIRTESAAISHSSGDTGAQPLSSLRVADVGDVAMRMFDLPAACQDIRDTFSRLITSGCKALAIGGDHTITYPILQAYKEVYGPVGLIHVDAHPDTTDHVQGFRVCHSTPIRRCVEEGLLECQRVVQIGLRAPGNQMDDLKWGIEQGFRVIPARHCWHKSLAPLMEEVREQMGDGPVYISFDIDGLDASDAPGTGFPEIGGLTGIQALEVLRGCRGLNIVGGDMVEVSPAYDASGNTSLMAANLLFEMLCVLPGVKYADIPI